MNIKYLIGCEHYKLQAISKMTAEYEERKKNEDTYDILVKDKLDLQYQVCDLTSLKSVMQFWEWFKSTGLVCNVLICNACAYSLKEGNTQLSIYILVNELQFNCS